MTRFVRLECADGTPIAVNVAQVAYVELRVAFAEGRLPECDILYAGDVTRVTVSGTLDEVLAKLEGK